MKLKCPHCVEKIGLFTKEWQSQRNLEVKNCPACTKKVKVTLSGKRFAMVLPICAVLIYLLWSIIGTGALALLVGITILAGSMQMEQGDGV